MEHLADDAAVGECRNRAEELADGRVVVERRPTASGQGVGVMACGLIDALPAAVWPVLRDCEMYESFLPGVERSQLLGRADGVARCKVLIDLPFPLGELWSVSRVEEEDLAGGGFQRRWTLESGDYERNDGSWTLLPWSGPGGATLAVYQLETDPKTIIPDFLLGRIQSSTAPGVFEAVRQRVRHCAANPCRGAG